MKADQQIRFVVVREGRAAIDRDGLVPSRVNRTRRPIRLSIAAFNRRPTCSARSFSLAPPGPCATGLVSAGAIDPAVAEYWREHYDLTALLEHDWDRLGTRLAGTRHGRVRRELDDQARRVGIIGPR